MTLGFDMTLRGPVRRIKSFHGIYALLLAANIFMGAIVMEQSRVIETQRVLIKNLFYDNVHDAAARLRHAALNH